MVTARWRGGQRGSFHRFAKAFPPGSLPSLTLSSKRSTDKAAEGFSPASQLAIISMCSIAIVDPLVEAMADSLREVDISKLRRDNIPECLVDIEKRVPDDKESQQALTAFMPHIFKYAHVLLDFYEDSGLSPEEFKNVIYELVNDFRLEPEQRIFEEQQHALETFGAKLKEHLQQMAVVISSKTHEDVRGESTEFMKGVDVSELEGLGTALLIKARALSHLLIIVHENGKKKGQSEDEFQEKCASDIASVLGENV